MIPFLLSLFLFLTACDKEKKKETSLTYEVNISKFLEQTYAPYLPRFEPPQPGTYQLPVIKCVSDHLLIDKTGGRLSLFSLKRDKIAVISFIYINCYDFYGCSMANYYMSLLNKEVNTDKDLSKKVILMSISFDYERDTPEVIREYSRSLYTTPNWVFLTTEGGRELEGLLSDFGQRVQKLYDEKGNWLGFRHTLKVYLVDKKNCIRNIYSIGMLYHKLVLNDIRTLLLEEVK
ncbi:MAG: SCO family protein [Hydrogenobacter thermophilus]|nr:MAG: SCO family protein [Hydrogenobacter thermophilus]